MGRFIIVHGFVESLVRGLRGEGTRCDSPFPRAMRPAADGPSVSL
jgi:hypothetical protein